MDIFKRKKGRQKGEGRRGRGEGWSEKEIVAAAWQLAFVDRYADCQPNQDSKHMDEATASEIYGDYERQYGEVDAGGGHGSVRPGPDRDRCGRRVADPSAVGEGTTVEYRGRIR